jgi:hypothetical protein
MATYPVGSVASDEAGESAAEEKKVFVCKKIVVWRPLQQQNSLQRLAKGAVLVFVRPCLDLEPRPVAKSIIVHAVSDNSSFTREES